jgi:hypothetical protein
MKNSKAKLQTIGDSTSCLRTGRTSSRLMFICFGVTVGFGLAHFN